MMAVLENPYLKHVSPEDIPQKTGMNICIHSDCNVAGRPTALTRLINKYSIHKARCIIAHDDYLSYDKDILLSDKNSIDEAEEVVHQADFFHILRQPVNFGNIDFWELIHSKNSLIQYGGSMLRNNGSGLRYLHDMTGILPVVSSDWTLLSRLRGVYHINKMFDMGKVREHLIPRYDDPIVISHCPTDRRIKSTDLFLEVMERISKDYSSVKTSANIEVILIEGVSNEECLSAREAAHIHFDQIKLGTYGMSAVEAMAMGQVVLCGMSNFALSMCPEIPIVNVTEDTLESTIRNLLKHPGEIMEIGARGREWVKIHHDPVTILKQYLFLYDMIVNGARNIGNREELLIDENISRDGERDREHGYAYPGAAEVARKVAGI